MYGQWWLNEDPFSNYKSKVKEVERVYLTEEEIQTIINKDLTIERVAMVRDIFVFSCFTGLAYEDRLLPIFSNQKMNAYLKEIADICEINKDLTFHIARHTYATNVTLSNGVPLETVSKMLGHTNLRIW